MYLHDFSPPPVVYQLYAGRPGGVLAASGPRIQLLQSRVARELVLIHGLPRLSPTASEKHQFMPEG